MRQKQLTPVFLLGLTLALLAGCGTTPPAAPAEPTNHEAEPTTSPEPTAEPTAASKRVNIRWLLGEFGIGYYEILQAIADEFNTSQDRIELVLYDNSMDVSLAPYIFGDNPVDIVGPLGIRGHDDYRGAWMDLQPLIDASDYDMSDLHPGMVEFCHDKKEGQIGLPFGIYPSFVFVNQNLFDAAGLPYPPQTYSVPYVDENGGAHPWNLDTLRELSMKLTLDRSGNNATSPYFDADQIAQFGYLEQYTDMRGTLTLFGPGSLVANDGKTAQIPDHWRAGTHWIYDAMWKDHFWPTDAYLNSDLLGNGRPFESGNLAMAHVHMWFAEAWALDPSVVDFTWDTATVPAYGDQTTARVDVNTFRIPAGARNPEATFEVLTYLLSPEIVPKLLDVYGGMPARMSLQDEYLATYGETVFPGQDINWQVLADSIRYADNPNYNSWIPGFHETSEAYSETWTRLGQESNLDVDTELDTLLEKLQTIFDAVEE